MNTEHMKRRDFDDLKRRNVNVTNLDELLSPKEDKSGTKKSYKEMLLGVEEFNQEGSDTMNRDLEESNNDIDLIDERCEDGSEGNNSGEEGFSFDSDLEGDDSSCTVIRVPEKEKKSEINLLTNF